MRAIVLGAGKGKRLLSEKFNLPKVLREVAGKPLIKYVLDNISFIEERETVIVIGYRGDMVVKSVGGEYKYALQNEQKGTGHAVMCAADYFDGYEGDVIILYGDMPLFKGETYKAIIEEHHQSGADLTLLTSIDENPPPYGRIIRDADGAILDIVEEKDANEEQRKINELNVGIFVVKSTVLFEGLKKIENNNSQGEYYLTDLPKILISEGKRVTSYTIHNSDEIYGVNTPEDLEFCEKVLRGRGL